MSVALLVISDDRPEYHFRSMQSTIDNLLIDYRFDQFISVKDPNHELGFAGAIQKGWSQVKTDFVFHLEADFTFNRPVPLVGMTKVLLGNPHLVQIALMRQPWNEDEREAGSIVMADPSSYTYVRRWGYEWTEHRKFVTTNPALWPRWVIDRGWPQRTESEGHFGIDLFASDYTLRSAFWGHNEEYVEHIGALRSGKGY